MLFKKFDPTEYMENGQKALAKEEALAPTPHMHTFTTRHCGKGMLLETEVSAPLRKTQSLA